MTELNVVESIEKWLTDNPDGIDNDEFRSECHELAWNAADYFKDALVTSFLDANMRGNNVSASSAGKCVRQLAYKYHGFTPEPFEPRVRINMFMGHVWELLVVFLAQMSGVNIENQQKETNVDGLKGHLDFTVGEVVYDVKSKTSFGFDAEAKKGIENLFGEATQGAIYCASEGAKEFRHLNINKQTAKMAEVVMVPDPFDVKKALERKDAVEASTPDSLPAREHQLLWEKKNKRGYLDIPCAYCSFKWDCWDIDEKKQITPAFAKYYARGEKN